MADVEGRVLYRLMLAAAEVTTENDREACVLGAILRSMIDKAGPHKFDPHYVLATSFKLHEWGRYVTGDPERFPLASIDVFDIAPMYIRFRVRHKESRT